MPTMPVPKWNTACQKFIISGIPPTTMCRMGVGSRSISGQMRTAATNPPINQTDHRAATSWTLVSRIFRRLPAVAVKGS
jgi:hypothetical protein